MKPSVIVGGLPELAELCRRSGRFEEVFSVESTGEFQAQAAARAYPSKEKLVLVFADSTREEGARLDFILARLAGAGYPILLLNVTGVAMQISAKYPAIATMRGGATFNQILGAISGMSPFTLDPVEWGHTPVSPGMDLSNIGVSLPTPAPIQTHDETAVPRNNYQPRPARDAWTPEGQIPGVVAPAPRQAPTPEPQPAVPAPRVEPTPAPAPRMGEAASPMPAPMPAPAPVQPEPRGWEEVIRGEAHDEPRISPTPAAPVPRHGALPQGVVAPRGGAHLPSKCMTITVAASKGGTGKSSVALNIAAFLGLRTNQEVAIIDLNIQQADVGKYIGDYESKTIVDLVSNLPQITPENVRDYMAYSREGDFYAILGPHNPQHADPGVLNSKLYRTILDILRRTFDYVIIDTPVSERYHELVSNFAMKEADRVIFVVAPNWTTIHNARLYLDLMTREVNGPRLPPERVGWVLNQYRDDIDCDIDDVRAAMSQYRYLGTLPYTTEWLRANNNFELIVTQRYEEINRAFAEMLREVTGVNFPVRPASEKKPSWFDRIRGR